MARKISTRRENHTDNSHNAAVPRVNAILSRENGGHWMPRERERRVENSSKGEKV